jgi:hypothetical protein
MAANEDLQLIDCLINGVVQRVTPKFCSLHGTPVAPPQWEPKGPGTAAKRKTGKSISAKPKKKLVRNPK